ncbi:MAG TPA: sugar porter family MFS transporter [Chitinophagaceae bacterium]|nr:sugar porter family MFS transporter [Chitinophagaceae bacterium]
MNYPVRIALIAALGGFLFGFETAVISGAEKTIQQLWHLESFLQGLTVASSLIGTVVGSIVAARPAQHYGRKKVLLFIAVMYLLSALGCALSPLWVLFIFCRFIGGIAVGISSVVGPMYIAEISPARIRGRLVGFFQLNIVTGIFIAYLSNYLLVGLGENSWRWMLGIMAVPAGMFWLLLQYIPESPRWLILNNRDAEAKKIFEKIGEQHIQEEVLEIHQHAGKGVQEKLFNGKYSKPILFAMVLAFFNQVSGINAIIYYAPRIFEMAGITKNAAFLQSVSIGATNLVLTLFAMSMIDKFGRKALLLIGSVGMIIFLALAAFSIEQTSGGYALMACLIGFIAFFAFSQGAVIWVFISEIFPNSVRSQGQSLGSFTHWIMAAIVSWSFPVIVENLPHGGKIAFLFFSVMMLLHFIFVWRILPETKGKSLESIQRDLGIE